MRLKALLLPLLLLPTLALAEQTIPVSPAEFSVAFNRYATKLKWPLVMGAWPEEAGIYRATVAPGLVVLGVAVEPTRLLQVRLHCEREAHCSQAMFAVALGLDKQADLHQLADTLQDFITQRLDGLLPEDETLVLDELAYQLTIDRSSGRFDFIVHAAQPK